METHRAHQSLGQLLLRLRLEHKSQVDDERLGERLDAAPHVGRHLRGEDVADHLDVAGPRVVPRLDGLPHHPRT